MIKSLFTNKWLILMSVSALIIIGCEEETIPSSTVTSARLIEKKLTSFYQSEELLYSFEYNSDKQLSRQVIRFPDGNFVSTFEYNDFGKMEGMVGVNNGAVLELRFHYTDNQLLDSMSSVVDGGVWVINKFFYNEENELSRMIEFSPGVQSIVYNDYTWVNGNITRRETYYPEGENGFSNKWIVEYEYDTLVNPFKSVFQDVGFHLIDREPISRHNWTHLKIYNYASGVVFREIDREFLYLGNGYPYRNRTFLFNGGNRSETAQEVVSDFFY